MPRRIQRKRTKGWRMPENTVYVGRPTIWGNPFRVTDSVTPAMAVEAYRNLLSTSIGRAILQQSIPLIRAELAGKDLACWCPLDQPCHADILLEIANS